MFKMVTQDLMESAMLDVMPRRAAVVDFGLDSIRHMQVVFDGIRSGKVSGEELDAALGDGKKLTELFKSKYPTVEPPVIFTTAYDNLKGDGWDE